MKYVVYHHLYIPWKFGERGSTPRGATGPSFSFLYVCMFVRHAKMLGTESLDGAYTHWTLGGTGISPPDSFSYRSNFRFRSRFRSRSSSSSTTSGDIFYCSGSRQLNHSSSCCCCCCRRRRRRRRCCIFLVLFITVVIIILEWGYRPTKG